MGSWGGCFFARCVLWISWCNWGLVESCVWLAGKGTVRVLYFHGWLWGKQIFFSLAFCLVCVSVSVSIFLFQSVWSEVCLCAAANTCLWFLFSYLYELHKNNQWNWWTEVSEKCFGCCILSCVNTHAIRKCMVWVVSMKTKYCELTALKIIFWSKTVHKH